MSEANSIPSGVPVVMPMLVCRDVVAEIDFCKVTFETVELVRRPGPDGKVAHAALKIGGAMIMLEVEWPSLASRAPQMDASSPVVIYVYVADVDAAIERAVATGAKILLPVKDQFWGDRTGRIIDPSGHGGPFRLVSKRLRPLSERSDGPALPRRVEIWLRMKRRSNKAQHLDGVRFEFGVASSAWLTRDR